MSEQNKHTDCKEDESEGKSFWTILGIASIICVAICIVGIVASYGYVKSHSGTNEDLFESRGLFGDSWGGVNALISALAFAGVIATLYLQNTDLRLQRKELKAQRKEFIIENETLKYQRFENLFYNMLNLQQRIVEGLKYNHIDYEDKVIPLSEGGERLRKQEVRREIVGRDVFRFMFNEVTFNTVVENHYYSLNGYREFFRYASLSGYNNTTIPTYFDHYFRHLFQIVEFVDEQNFNYEESYKYISLLRSTLSRYEMVWIYYHALQPENRKCKEWIEKYSLLKGIRGNLLALSIKTGHPYEGLFMIEEELEEDGFGQGDFECYLTDNPEEHDKYYLSAFWDKATIEEGKKYFERWRELFTEKYLPLIQDINLKIEQNKRREKK